MNQWHLGRYWPASSFWHRRDPLIKLLLLAVFIAANAAAGSLPAVVMLCFPAGLAWVTARLPWRLWAGAVKPFLWLIVLTLAANLFFAPGSSHPRPVVDGAILAVTNVLRLLLLFTAGAWLTGTTSSLALTKAIGRLAAPWRRLGLPAEEFTLLMGLGLRLLPELVETGGRIRLAQRARGVGTGRTWRDRLLGAEALTLALFAQAFRRADDLALAMEARGFSSRQVATGTRADWDWRDIIALLAGLAAIAFLYWAGRR